MNRENHMDGGVGVWGAGQGGSLSPAVKRNCVGCVGLVGNMQIDTALDHDL